MLSIPYAESGPMILHYHCEWDRTLGLAEKHAEIEVLRCQLNARRFGLPSQAHNKWVHTSIVQLSFEIIRLGGIRALRLRYATPIVD